MSGAKSKRKGSAFENEIAKFLNGIHDTEEFARTPGSGAWMGRSNSFKRSGVAAAAQETLRGDLITPSSFPFIIECKSYADAPSYNGIIKGPDKLLDKWLSEVEFDAEQAGCLPMLWFKTSRKGTFVALPKASLVAHFPDLVNTFEYALCYRNYMIVSQENYGSVVQHYKLFS
jgi:hypothetical protein